MQVYLKLWSTRQFLEHAGHEQKGCLLLVHPSLLDHHQPSPVFINHHLPSFTIIHYYHQPLWTVIKHHLFNLINQMVYQMEPLMIVFNNHDDTIIQHHEPISTTIWTLQRIAAPALAFLLRRAHGLRQNGAWVCFLAAERECRYSAWSPTDGDQVEQHPKHSISVVCLPLFTHKTETFCG